MAELRIGCSGWVYKHWRELFYPAGLPTKKWLAHYADIFNTAEINGSFYKLPSETAVRGWRETAPEDFLFAWKVSKYLTHAKKLKDPADSLALIFDRMRGLGEKQGPALFQLPPQLKLNYDRLAALMPLLPAGRRCAFEFRDPSWYRPEVFRLLADHDAALCISDHHHAPAPWERTASWVYVRGHGPGGRYWGRYPDETLQDWARRLRVWRREGRDVVCYFDNDPEGAAPKDALRLIELAGA